MDYYRNILITGCSSGLGQALFNRVWEDDTLVPFAHYRNEHGDPHALIGDITAVSYTHLTLPTNSRV